MVFVDADEMPFNSLLVLVLHTQRRSTTPSRAQMLDHTARARHTLSEVCALTIASADACSPSALASPSFCGRVTLASAAETGEPRYP